MAIKITCPNCKRGMLVPESLAGKKGRCKACQHILTVPQLAAPASTASEAAKPPAPAPVKPPTAAPAPAKPPVPAPARAADVEAEAAALFADEPKAAAPVEVKLIDLNCPFCDEAIQLPLDLAGKRAPCPECKNIIKVPEPAKKDPKDWRKLETKGPAGARRPEEPALEGAWGSTTARGVAAETLKQVGLIPEVERPRTTWQKIRWPVLGTSAVLVLIIGGWRGYRWWGERAADRAVAEALAFAATPEAGPGVKAALSTGAGDFYAHSRTAHPDPRTGRSDAPAVAARKQFGAALTTLRAAPPGDERDGLLADLALALIEVGGDREETDQELRLPWDEIQKMLIAGLQEISRGEARLQALRAVARRLVERGQSKRVLPLTTQIFPRGNKDAEKSADQAVALVVVSRVFRKAQDQENADKAEKAALALYDDKSPPLRPEVIALAQIQKKKMPPAGDNENDKANEHLGIVTALAWEGEWDKARQRAAVDDFGEVVQFRARLAVAAAAVEAQVPDTTHLEDALKMAEGSLSHKAELSWSLLRLTQLGLATSLPQERVQALADNIGNPAVRGRAQLAVFRANLDRTKQPVEDSAADKIEATSLARGLAALALARHNTRLGADAAAAAQSWPQPLRSFGSLGVALGLEDRGR